MPGPLPGFAAATGFASRQRGGIFAIQDELVHAIVTALAERLETDGLERALRKLPESLAAYDYYLRGLLYHRLYDSRSVVVGREALERAVALDPTFARAYGLLAFFKMIVGWFEGKLDYASDEILELARKAVELVRSLARLGSISPPARCLAASAARRRRPTLANLLSVSTISYGPRVSMS